MPDHRNREKHFKIDQQFASNQASSAAFVALHDNQLPEIDVSGVANA
ncbi:hypothetical protein [Rhizobium leguminosarum]|nr:hypothetical protein [Rhizobium leguminosarum]MBY5347162.1 hypothetical protein [Rhizobium leguminosarum]